MAVKTITVDMEAYELLVAARRSSESFSTVIKTVLVPASHTASSLLRYLDAAETSADYLDAMERVIATREEDMIAAESPAPYSGTGYGS
jgi:predicted CopG family antitoxin